MSTIPVLRCAAGVQFAVIAPGGFRMLAALDGLSKVLGRDVWLTSGTDRHRAGRHPTGEAYDVRVTGWTVPMIAKALQFLRQTLGARFTVLYEVTTAQGLDDTERAIATVNLHATARHLHLQVKRATIYPPIEPVAYDV
jgi:hypothetical protein